MYRLHHDDVRARGPHDEDAFADGPVLGAAASRRAPGNPRPVSRGLGRAAMPPPSLADAMPFTYTSNLSEVRAKVRSYAKRAGLSEARLNDLVIAVSEAAANTVRHARSPGTLDMWHDEHEIVCEIRDQGVITDPLAGKRRPASDALAGHGLWLVHQLCDLVELLSGDSGTTIRMHMTLRGADAEG
ncbi:MAG TPA: ATP-binding protein [Trebonia sp.]|nr:ATP-binding protein [Trebonia sp.]